MKSAVFSPGGSRVLAASSDGSATMWDTVTGRRQASFKADDDALEVGCLFARWIPNRNRVGQWIGAYLGRHQGDRHLGSQRARRQGQRRRLFAGWEARGNGIGRQHGAHLGRDDGRPAAKPDLRGLRASGLAPSFRPTGRASPQYCGPARASVWNVSTGARMFTIDPGSLDTSSRLPSRPTAGSW